MKFLGYRPDIVFSSETYGKTWAEAMGCRYVDVDIARRALPISGTLVRRDLLKSWDYLSDQTKAGLAIRIVVVGAESTGTTTLTQSLAESLKAPWVPEVGSFYTHSLATSTAGSREKDYCKVDWQTEDFHTIGKLQQQYEAAMAARSDGVIVCDTNATATEIWQRRYLGKTSPEMKAIAAKDSVHLYIITSDDIPFEQNGIRDGQAQRSSMQRWFIKRVKQTGVPFIIVTGSKSQRLNQSKKEARRIIKQNRIIK
jgi:NadR type nicotinamide-nucleotide adenylyltransferase